MCCINTIGKQSIGKVLRDVGKQMNTFGDEVARCQISCGWNIKLLSMHQ